MFEGNMGDPILEALSFSLESDLEMNIDDSQKPSTSNFSTCESAVGEPSYNNTNSSRSKNKNSEFVSSWVILGENSQTPCLWPGCYFISSSPLVNKLEKSAFLQHLLLDHKFVFDQVDQIANLHKYILYWKEKFSSAPLTDFCVAFWMDEPPIVGKPVTGPSGNTSQGSSLSQSERESKEKEKYFMLTDVLPEDKELRKKLWNNRLELVLEVNRKEREQKDFSRHCLFCKEVCTENRSNLFQHMTKDHSFYIGQPDNVVFVDELLQFINDKLNDLICIYCEKVFKDKAVLREHMRKKQHKRINPTSPEYDRFYLVNYLEPGKTWKALDEEDQEDDRVEEEWIEMRQEGISIVCLFCSHQSTDFDSILAHMITDHKFNFEKITINCDFYQKVKIVNFVRRCVYQNICLFCEKRFLEKTSLVQHILTHGNVDDVQMGIFPSAKVWNQPEYFFPTYENDQFLVHLDSDDNMKDEAIDINSEDESSKVIPEDRPVLSKLKSNLKNFGDTSQ